MLPHKISGDTLADNRNLRMAALKCCLFAGTFPQRCRRRLLPIDARPGVLTLRDDLGLVSSHDIWLGEKQAQRSIYSSKSTRPSTLVQLSAWRKTATSFWNSTTFRSNTEVTEGRQI